MLSYKRSNEYISLLFQRIKKCVCTTKLCRQKEIWTSKEKCVNFFRLGRHTYYPYK